MISNINASHFTQYYMSANNDGGEDDVLLKVEEAAEPVVKSTQPPQPNFDQNFQNTQNQEDQGPAGMYSSHPSKHKTFTHCCYNAGPPSATLAHHFNNNGSMSCVF